MSDEKRVDIRNSTGWLLGSTVLVDGKEIPHVRWLALTMSMDRLNRLELETVQSGPIDVSVMAQVDIKTICPHCGQKVTAVQESPMEAATGET